jgi:dTMP kinase
MATTTTVSGLLVSLEGPDCAGKSTQAKRLAASLPNCVLKAFPDRTEATTGNMLNSMLKGVTRMNARVAHLLFSANRWACVPMLEQALSTPNSVVVLDRYRFSGLVYSHVAGGCPLEWCVQSDKQLVEPDLTFFLVPANHEELLRTRFCTHQQQQQQQEIFDNMQLQLRIGAEFVRLSSESKNPFDSATERIVLVQETDPEAVASLLHSECLEALYNKRRRLMLR